MAEPYGTIQKYRNAIAIKKHNKLIQPWASSLALQVASVFWATWKGIEERLPTGEEAVEAEKPVDSRNLKNKYSAIIRVEVNRHSEAMEEAIREHIYKVWLAGAVEQCRHLGCTSFFLSSLSRSSQTSESLDTPEMPSALSEATVKADSSGWVSLPNYRAQEYAKKHAAEAVTQINDTTRKEIAKIVADGVKNGTSYNDIAKAIKTRFEEFAVPKPQQHVPNRAVLVAVTELANAYCAGNMQVGNFLQDSGLKMMKAWQTLEDNRVSDGCRENERVGWIPIDKEFPSGHMHPPRFPGCRCDFLQDILEEDMLGKPIDALYGEQYVSGKSSSPKVSGIYSPGKNMLGDKESADRLYSSLLGNDSAKEMMKLNGEYYESSSDKTREEISWKMDALYRSDKYEESTAIEYIVSSQGFDGLPKKIRLNEFDENRGVYRGVSADDRETVLSYHDDLLNGTWYYSAKYGGHLYGRGMYTSKNIYVADSYARGSDIPIVERMQFKNGARVYVVGENDWKQRFSVFKRDYPEEAEMARRSCNDVFGLELSASDFEQMMNSKYSCMEFSDLLAAMGFDGMEVSKKEYVIVFNRTALEIVDEDV